MLSLRGLVVLCTLPLLVLGAKKRATTPQNFNLYGYGPRFGGIPLFCADGYAYIGEVDQANATDAAIALFSSSSNNVWTASPNATNSSATLPSWSNVTFFVPDAESSDKRVGFLSEDDTSTDGEITSGFRFYGSTAALVGSSGSLQMSWYSLQVSERVHALYWNDTSLGQVPVILRNIAPSNPPN